MTQRGADYQRRKLDDYPTPPEVLDVLFTHVKFSSILDPACGRLKRVVSVAEQHGYAAGGMDIISGDDFLHHGYDYVSSDIVTNPPYGDRRGSLALRFIERSLELTRRYRKRVAMLLPIDFDSGKTRLHVFQHPAFTLKLVLLDRIRWFNGQAGSTNHAWYVWNWNNVHPPIIRYARIEHGDHEPKKRRAHRTRRSARDAGRRAQV